jgi:Icc protein
MPETILRFVHISDTHISPDADYPPNRPDLNTRRGAEALVHQLNALPFTPDFILHTGDVVYDPDPAAYEVAKEILGRINYPVYYLRGNHDDSDGLQRAMLGRKTVQPWAAYTFDVNNVQIICLDSNVMTEPEPPRGLVNDEQLVWLQQLCAAKDERPLVVAIHHNPLPVDVPWLDDYMILINGEAVHQALLPARHRLRGVFFGHVHQNLSIYRDGILYSSVLSSWCQFHAWPGQTPTIYDDGAEPGFNVITLTQDQTYIRHCRFRV